MSTGRKHVHIDETDPEHYKTIKQQQDRLKEQFRHHVVGARLCPYCRRILMLFCEGSHSMVSVKCDRCGEEVYLAPVTSRDMERARGIFDAVAGADLDDLVRLRLDFSSEKRAARP